MRKFPTLALAVVLVALLAVPGGNLYRITVSADAEVFAEANEKYFRRILDSFEILPE